MNYWAEVAWLDQISNSPSIFRPSPNLSVGPMGWAGQGWVAHFTVLSFVLIIFLINIKVGCTFLSYNFKYLINYLKYIVSTYFMK